MYMYEKQNNGKRVSLNAIRSSE